MEFESDRGSVLWQRDHHRSTLIRMNRQCLTFGARPPMRIKESLHASIGCRARAYLKNAPLRLPGFDRQLSIACFDSCGHVGQRITDPNRQPLVNTRRAWDAA